jgi:N-acetylmuramoyl-L-alanine amidase
MRSARTWAYAVGAICLTALVTACGSTAPRSSTDSSSAALTPLLSSAAKSSAIANSTSAESNTASPASPPNAPPVARPASSAPPTGSSVSVHVPPGTGPVIVIDPGHSPSITSTDPSTGLIDSDYENEPEMRDVFAVALLVKAQLQADGYRVVLTKASATTRISLGQRAAIANAAHAALAISIHDQAGTSGGIGFNSGNNTVYYQTVGDYRATPSGKKVYFTNTAVAAKSKAYGAIFQSKRAAAEGHSVRLQSDVGYNLGTRPGLAAGNIWMVQLLSTVPWIYNEAGGNSAGMAGLNATDKAKYARGLVTSIEIALPVTG